MKLHLAVPLAIWLLGAAACGPPDAERASPSPPSRSGAADAPAPEPVDPATVADWNVGVTEAAIGRTQGTSTLIGVITSREDGFDRIVFTWEAAAPPIHLEYVDTPVRDCGSGQAFRLEGDGWLEVRFYPARAHSDAGAPTLDRRAWTENLPGILEMRRTCDFEGVVTYVAGVSSPEPYRVLRLGDPARWIVDIQHPSP